MEKFIQILKKIFFLPPLPALLIALFGYALVIMVAAVPIEIDAIRYLSYFSSAYALIITITGFPHLKRFIKKVRRYVEAHPFMKRFKSTKIGSRFLDDVRFRTEISLYQGLLINSLYIAMKMFSGIYYRSIWFIALAFYYILLAVMRVMLLRKGKKNREPMIEELRRYRMCGITLLLMSQALAGIVIFMVHRNKGFDYPGMLIYLMAMYAFYSVITAVVNLVKFRKHGSPILSAAKAINLVAAMVSILSLETAMLAQFGGDDEFRSVMTSATGGGVCTITIGIAIFMIVKSTRKLKVPMAQNSQEVENYE